MPISIALKVQYCFYVVESLQAFNVIKAQKEIKIDVNNICVD